MSNGLRVAPGLVLPRETVVEKQAILAMSGAGKSNTAVVLAEAMYDAGLPWVAIDPKGDWWGVRAGRDGKGVGLQVPIFGGLHGDVPLESTAGALVANLVVDRRLTCVLDVSEFNTNQERYRFLADFAETLLKRNKEPLHVFAEEADEYLPQTAREKGAQLRCLGAWQKLVKRGRFRGIGTTLITQRSASINKDVLNMTDTLIVMRTAGTRDRKAISEWVGIHGGDEGLIESLPALGDGEAWVWSPQKLKLTKRVQFLRRRTYDSGATPLLDTKAKVARLADVDLGALRDQMAETIERAEADDPALLRKRIRELEAQVKAAPAGVKIEEVRVEVEIERVPEWLSAQLREAVDALGPIMGDVTNYKARLAKIATAVMDEAKERPVPKNTGRIVSQVVPRPPVTDHRTVAAPPAPTREYAVRSRGEEVYGGEIGKGPSTILGVLRTHGGTMAKDRLRLLTGQAKSTFDRYMVTLRGSGYVTDGNPVNLTDAGAAVAPDGEVMPPPGSALFAWWCNHPKVGTGPRAILVALRAAGGVADKAELRDTVEQAKSTFDRYMVTLRGLGIVTGHGTTVELDDDLR